MDKKIEDLKMLFDEEAVKKGQKSLLRKLMKVSGRLRI